MKKRIIIIFSVMLITFLVCTSCSSFRKRTALDDIPKISDKKDDSEKAETKVDNNSLDKTDKPEDKDENVADENVAGEISEFSKSEEASTNEQPIKKGVATSHSYAYISPEDLESKADIIFVGEYTGQSFETLPNENFINGQFMHEKIYTNYIFKPLNVVKGDTSEELLIRCAGGTIGDTKYVTNSSVPNFTEGKKYFMYVRERELLSADDKQSYIIITTNCYEVNESGELLFTSDVSEEDKAKLQEQYDKASNTSNADTE